MNLSRFPKTLVSLLLCIIFWAISWSISFKIAYPFLFPGEDGKGIDFNLFKFVPVAGAIGGAVFGTLIVRPCNRQDWQNFQLKNLIFWFVVWDLLIPLIWTLDWWKSDPMCSCDWMCFCGFSNTPILDIFMRYFAMLLLLSIFTPLYFLVAPVVSVPLGWLFQKLFRRLFQA